MALKLRREALARQIVISNVCQRARSEFDCDVLSCRTK
jgi:hypothetical protein